MFLKEDQAQNMRFHEFALRLMGDVQASFIDRSIRNFYSVSISGYHIAEAGANPITQLAFTLANGFTYVEYYLSRGMDLNEFGPNLSFFFSNGIDPEYAVIGRVARRIWAKAMREKYGASARAQMLKYHIQTRAVRCTRRKSISTTSVPRCKRCTPSTTTAIHCTPMLTTRPSQRQRNTVCARHRHPAHHQQRARLTKNENPLQGSYIIEALTDLVEEAVMVEFERITERGGVIGAMETMYQRSRIQEESLHYETLKHTGEFPIIGVNTFLAKNGSPTLTPGEVIRAETAEKEAQLEQVARIHDGHTEASTKAINAVKAAATEGKNVFESLLVSAKHCTLGQLSDALWVAVPPQHVMAVIRRATSG